MKLSELSKDTMLVVGNIEHNCIMDKEDYLADKDEYKNEELFLAEKMNLGFDLYDAIECQIQDETYEDGVLDIWLDLEDCRVLIERLVNEAIDKNPSYTTGAIVEIDV